MRTVEDLRLYQRRGATHVFREPATALLVDMGLGKTIIVLSAVRGLLHHRKRTSALVAMPPRVLETEVWQQEAARWSHTKHLRFKSLTTRRPLDPARFRGARQQAAEKSLALATAKTQAELTTPADLYLTTYDNLPWLARLAGTRSEKPKIPLPDILVLDESSMIKNAGSLRFKALRHRLLRFFKTVVILTGTPMPNSLMEIWPQIYVLDQGARLGPSFDRFKTRFFEQTDYMGFHWEPRTGATDYVLDLIKDLTIRLDAEDWVRMPSIIPNRIDIPLPSTVMRLYRQHEREMFTQLSATKAVTAVSAATLSMQCHQFANGAIYDDPEERSSWTELHAAKLAALEELIESHPGQSIMVAYWFRHDLQRLRQRWPEARVLDKKNPKQTEADWNARKIPLLFIHPMASGHGLNMQHGGHIIVWFSLTWSLEAHDQLIGRLRRPDQKADAILCHYLVASDTVDEAIMQTVGMKDHHQRHALATLRAYMLEKSR